MSDTQNPWEEAGEVYSFALNFSRQDSARGLRYPLLRLGILLDIPGRDMEELSELGRIVIQVGDVEEVADRIRERRGTSPLVVAIASIVRDAELSSGGAPRAAMLGAVFGAYAGLKTSQIIGEDPRANAILGAIGGALSATTYTRLQEILEARSLSWREWSKAE